jgi:hypothetical protein
MKRTNWFRRKFKKLKDNKGAVMPIVALFIFVLVGALAFAVDAGWVVATNNELQNVADAGALAGTGELGHEYLNDPDADQASASIMTIAKDVAIKNKAANVNITLNDADIELGLWSNNSFGKEPCPGKCNAVKVTSRRDESANGAFPSFFASIPIFGINEFSSSKHAVAALTGASEIAEGELTIPVGISKSWFELNDSYPKFCGRNIQFYPTIGCARWHAYDSRQANASNLENNILPGLTNDTFTAPGAKLGDGFVFIDDNDVSSATEEKMYTLWNTKRYADNDGDDNIWTTNVVVYDAPCVGNPSGYVGIAGFATVEISVKEVSPLVMTARVICEEVELARGGGGEYGTWGSIPNLVE